jgi:hypothetical protein
LLARNRSIALARIKAARVTRQPILQYQRHTVDTASSPTWDSNSAFIEARRHRRFKLETCICVYPRNEPVVRGDTVDLSESGISAVLREEVPLGGMVRLTFTVPAGEIEILALVRQRNAFRYGFQFMEGGPASMLVRRTCAELAMKQVLHEGR